MLDDNLPTFYLKPPKDSTKLEATVLLSQYGAGATPAYSLRKPDPTSPDSKNRYAVALYDSYNPDILFGEVLLIPEWTQPSLSVEDIRNNGGVPPPPQPILPGEFTVQLYNPDQQVKFWQRPGSWGSTPYWEFEMPQQTFRQPSSSALDRTQSDPTASPVTPKIEFTWKRDSRLSKDLICNLSGKTRNPDGSKRKHKEPDIPMAFFRHLREITVYEPNLSRVEMEDPKGFEVVLLLGAATIRDVYFGQIRESFNISETSRQPAAVPVPAAPVSSVKIPPSQKYLQPITQGRPHSDLAPLGVPASQRLPLDPKSSNPRPPPTDPRSQWEIDAETVRLKKQVEREERERRRLENEETKRVKRMLEQEGKEAAKRQAAVDRESERLRRQFGVQQVASALPARHDNRPRTSADGRGSPYQVAAGVGPGASSSFFGTRTLRPKKSSWWGQRGNSDQGQRLMKKQSAIF